MAKRRGNGEGSVYRRGDGRVVGEWVDANGKRRYISGKTGVKRRLRELLADRNKGIAYDSESLTVGGYLDRWLEAAKGTVRERTWQRSEEVVRLHLKPTIGLHKLDKLNAMQVQTVYRQKLDEGLSARQLFFAVAILAYSQLLSIENFVVRSARMHDCGLELGTLVDDMSARRIGNNPVEEKEIYDEFAQKYTDILSHNENHSTSDYKKYLLRIWRRDKAWNAEIGMYPTWWDYRSALLSVLASYAWQFSHYVAVILFALWSIWVSICFSGTC